MQTHPSLKVNTTVQNIAPQPHPTKRLQPKKSPTYLPPSCTTLSPSLDPPSTTTTPFIPSSLCQIPPHNQPSSIFTLYHQFLTTLIDNTSLLTTIFSELNFSQTPSPNKTIKLSIKSLINEKSFHTQQITSLEDFNNYMKKRISIEVIQSNLSLESFGSIHYDSETTFQSDLVLTKEIVQQLFQNPSPFIMTESICLLLKYLWRTKGRLTRQNCVKLVLISTMLAFKLCYDQEVEGIGWYYASIVSLESKEIPKLEAKFVKELEFETDITKNQYFTVSSYLLTK